MSSSTFAVVNTRRKPLAVCVAAVFALSGSATVCANTFSVTNCLDNVSDVGSLRWAASKAGSGDVIDMTLITNPAACTTGLDSFQTVIMLSSVVTVADGVTINGPAGYAFGSALAVSTNLKDRIFSSYGFITINNLAMVYGSSTVHSGSVYGGCVYASKGIALTNVTLDRCVAINYSPNSGDSAKGGAIGTYSGPITVTDGRITRSSAYEVQTGTASGGALYAGGDVTLTNSFVGYGKATTGNGNAVGGGIAATGNVTLAGSKVTYVNANSYTMGKAAGGAIFGAGTVTLNNSVISHNGTFAAGSSVSRGAGVYSTGSTTVNYSSISNNSASGVSTSEGGGIFSNGGLKAVYGAVGNNRAMSYLGGGVGGGAFVNNGNTYLRGTSIYGNYVQGYSSALNATAGGTTTINIINSTISGNSTSSTGAYGVDANALTTKFFNSTIAYNTGGSGLGGVYFDGGTIGLYSTLMSSNSGAGYQLDFAVNGPIQFTAGSSNNLIRTPIGNSVPPGTITGKCPFLHPLAFNGGPTPTHRLGGASHANNSAIDAGSNPLSLGSDQRGGTLNAMTPLRVSGNAADIGAYEVQHADIIFDNEFDTCPN